MGVPDKYDIAIVGGGIAGLYCCLQADPDKKVALFESTNRMGGWIEPVGIIKKSLGETKKWNILKQLET
jgi:protoporphyrinogen oxidase